MPNSSVAWRHARAAAEVLAEESAAKFRRAEELRATKMKSDMERVKRKIATMRAEAAAEAEETKAKAMRAADENRRRKAIDDAAAAPATTVITAEPVTVTRPKKGRWGAAPGAGEASDDTRASMPREPDSAGATPEPVTAVTVEPPVMVPPARVDEGARPKDMPPPGGSRRTFPCTYVPVPFPFPCTYVPARRSSAETVSEKEQVPKLDPKT